MAHRDIWVVGKGDTVCFWEDVWVLGCGELINSVPRNSNSPFTDRLVHEFVIVNGQWDWDVFGEHLDYASLLKLVAMRLPSNYICWSGESSGSFSTFSAYKLLVQVSKSYGEAHWKCIWNSDKPHCKKFPSACCL